MAVGRIVNGVTTWRVAIQPVTDADPCWASLDALIDEVFGKPGLGVDDSAGIIDAQSHFGFDDDASLGLVFTQYDDDYGIEDDADFHRFGGV